MPRVTISVPNFTPQPYRFDLDTKMVTIGRRSDNDIVIECGSVSGRHAEMVRVEGGFELRDLASTNGIKKNGARRDLIQLFDGDHVKLGDVGFDFQLGEEEIAALAADNPDANDAGKTKTQDETGEDGASPHKKLPKRRESHAPAAERAPAPARQPQTIIVKGGGGGFGMLMLFVLMAFAAFCVGLSMRHKSATGGSLMEAIQNRLGTPIDAPPPAAGPEDDPPAGER